MTTSKNNWKIDLKTMSCRNSVIGIEVMFIVTNRNALFGVVTRTESGLHQYVARIDCDLDCICDQLIGLARYHFARKYYKRDNPYKSIPDMPDQVLSWGLGKVRA